MSRQPPAELFVIVGADGVTMGMPYTNRGQAEKVVPDAREDRPSGAPYKVVRYIRGLE